VCVSDFFIGKKLNKPVFCDHLSVEIGILNGPDSNNLVVDVLAGDQISQPLLDFGHISLIISVTFLNNGLRETLYLFETLLKSLRSHG